MLAHANPIHDGNGRLLGAVKVLVDITERTAAESAQAHLAAIVSSSGDALVSKNLDGIIQRWNPAAESLFGYGADELIGQSVLMLLSMFSADDMRIAMQAAGATAYLSKDRASATLCDAIRTAVQKEVLRA